MSQLALARPLLQTKEKKKKRETIFKTKRKRKRKEILNNDLAVLPSHDNFSVYKDCKGTLHTQAKAQ